MLEYLDWARTLTPRQLCRGNSRCREFLTALGAPEHLPPASSTLVPYICRSGGCLTIPLNCSMLLNHFLLGFLVPCGAFLHFSGISPHKNVSFSCSPWFLWPSCGLGVLYHVFMQGGPLPVRFSPSLDLYTFISGCGMLKVKNANYVIHFLVKLGEPVVHSTQF